LSATASMAPLLTSSSLSLCSLSTPIHSTHPKLHPLISPHMFFRSHSFLHSMSKFGFPFTLSGIEDLENALKDTIYAPYLNSKAILRSIKNQFAL
jgi:hypothetical protein